MVGGAFEAVFLSETSVFDQVQEWWEGLFPIHTDDDLPATVSIDTEAHHPKKTVLMPMTSIGPNGMSRTVFIPRVRDAYDTFTVTIEGQQHIIRVSPEDAADYKPGDKIEVTYDRDQYKSGTKVTSIISDVKLRK